MGLWDVVKGVYDTVTYPITKPAEYVYDYLTGENVNRANKEIAQQTNQANLELYNKQHEDSVAQWQAENAYNTPTMQSARLRAAGLNPALMNGNNSTGVASALSGSMPTPHPAVGYEYRSPMSNASDLFNNISMASEAFKSFQQGETSRLGNQFVTQEHIKGLAFQDAQIDNLLSQVKKGSMEYSLLKAQKSMIQLQYKMESETFDTRKQSFDLQNDLLKSQMAQIEEQNRLSATQRALNESITALNKKDDEFFVRKMQATLAQLYQEVAVGKANEKLINETELKTRAEKNGIKISNDQARQILPYVVEQAKYLPLNAQNEYRIGLTERYMKYNERMMQERFMENPWSNPQYLLGLGRLK